MRLPVIAVRSAASGLPLFPLLPLLLAALCGAAPPAVPRPVTPEESGKLLIQCVLREMPIDSIAGYFEEDLRSELTPENIKDLRSQMAWLAGLIGDGLELFLSGTRDLGNGETVFFREFRFVNELNTRAPLLLVHLWYKDSLAVRATGAFAKTFLDDTKNRLAGEETWTIGGKEADIHSVAFAELERGIMVVVRVHDDDTAALDDSSVVARGAPIAREAFARGFLDSTQAAFRRRKPLDEIGIFFLRKDRNFGYTQYKYMLPPEHYLPPEAEKAEEAKKAKAEAKPAPVKKKTAPKKSR